ncbi:zinc finger MYM-type protein 1-like isoform X2, partial [Aphis craccivora]
MSDFDCGSKDEKTLASPNNDIGFIVNKVVLIDADKNLNKNRALQIEENRKRIKPLIECIILCGKEELALRGSKDFGPINVYDDIRPGHFRALLKYRAKGDDFLRTVLEGSGKRKKYTSPVIQNEIFQACNTILSRKIFFEIESLTGDALANYILNGLIQCGLDCNYLYGQGYDGACLGRDRNNNSSCARYRNTSYARTLTHRPI